MLCVTWLHSCGYSTWVGSWQTSKPGWWRIINTFRTGSKPELTSRIGRLEVHETFMNSAIKGSRYWLGRGEKIRTWAEHGWIVELVSAWQQKQLLILGEKEYRLWEETKNNHKLCKNARKAAGKDTEMCFATFCKFADGLSGGKRSN